MASAPKRAEAGKELICNYLEARIAAARRLETELRDFAGQGDDEDVQAAFTAQAEESQRQYQRLVLRLQQLGGAPLSNESGPGTIEAAPQIPLEEHIEEEGTVQHLVAAYAAETRERASYKVLASIAGAAGDQETAALAREIEAEKENAAKRIFGFIRTRSKIAYNMLTPNELDPAVETKAFDSRVG